VDAVVVEDGHHRRGVVLDGRNRRWWIAAAIARGVWRQREPVPTHVAQQLFVHPAGAGREVEADQRPPSRTGNTGAPHVDLAERPVNVLPPNGGRAGRRAGAGPRSLATHRPTPF